MGFFKGKSVMDNSCCLNSGKEDDTDFFTVADTTTYTLTDDNGNPLGNVQIDDVFIDGVRIVEPYTYNTTTSVLTIGATSPGVAVHVNYTRL